MSNDFSDWIEYQKFVQRDKAVERCKSNKIIFKSLPAPRTKVFLKTARLTLSDTSSHIISIDDRRTIEKSILNKLAKGTYPIDFSIDLHGHKLDQAYVAFYHAFFSSLEQNFKLILVITGKGSMDGHSIRSQFVQAWIHVPEIGKHILYISKAPQKHGGEGAFYLLLRKRKNGGSGRS